MVNWRSMRQTCATCLGLIWLLMPPMARAADVEVLDLNGSLAVGQPMLQGANVLMGGATMPLDRLLGAGGPAACAQWLDHGVVMADGTHLRGVILGLQKGTLQIASDLLGPLDVPAADIIMVALVPRPLEQTIPLDFTGAVLANGDRLAGQVVYLDTLSVGINNGRKVVAVPRERVSALLFHAGPIVAVAHQVLLLASGDRVVGKLTAWNSAELQWSTAKGILHCSADEWSALWSESATQRPLSSQVLSGLTPNVCLNVLPGGAPLGSGTRHFGHGFGIRGNASISASPDGATRLLGEAVVTEGRASIRVLADAKIVWESGTLAAGEPAKPFAAAIAGAQRVQLDIIAADDASPLVVVGWPTLVN